MRTIRKLQLLSILIFWVAVLNAQDIIFFLGSFTQRYQNNAMNLEFYYIIRTVEWELDKTIISVKTFRRIIPDDLPSFSFSTK